MLQIALVQLDELASVCFQATPAHPALEADPAYKAPSAPRASRETLDQQDLADSREGRVNEASPDQLGRLDSPDFWVETETRATLAILE